MSDETWVVALPKLGESVTEGVIGSDGGGRCAVVLL